MRKYTLPEDRNRRSKFGITKATQAQVNAAIRNDSIIPGPECFAATIPVNTNIPVPITAPIPKTLNQVRLMFSNCRGDSVLSAFS